MFGDARSLDSEAVLEFMFVHQFAHYRKKFCHAPSSSFGRQWSTARYPVFWQEIA